MSLKIIITGASGMIGEGVLYQCLNHNQVSKILVIGRKPCGHTHPKLTEIIHKDFFNLTPIQNQLSGYDACFFCLGVSSIGLSEPEYTKLTHTLTLNFAQTLNQISPNRVFCYISGTGTDSSEKGKSMWARVKGRTENDLLKLGFKNVYNFRPAYIQPTKGLKNTLPLYKYFSWMYPILKTLFPKYVCTLKEIGLAMINAVTKGYEKNILEGKDIKILSQK